MSIADAFKEIAEAAMGAVWAPEDMGADARKHDATAKAFVTNRLGWRLLVVSFARGEARGYDGTAMKGGLVMRLTPGLAEQFFKEADK